MNHTNHEAHNLTPESTAGILLQAGFSFVPTKINGTKQPSIKWQPYQRRLPTRKEIEAWYGGGKTRGIAAIMGEVSRNAETLDFDKADLFPKFCEALEGRAPGLLERLVQVRTPRPGYQVLYRCSTIGGNEELAWAERPATEEDRESKRAYQNEACEWVVRYASIETRGEGGYAIAVGSPARVHRNNQPYVFIGSRTYTTVCEITPDERQIIFEICRNLTEIQLPKHAESAPEHRRERKPGDPLLPGDDYNDRGDIRELLKKHGWTYCGDSRLGELWTRPGKNPSEGHSATLFPNGNFYVFSSSAHPLPQCNGHALSPFFVYTKYTHGDDFRAAAKDLARQGYGDQQKRTKNKRDTDASTNAESASDQEADDNSPQYKANGRGLLWLKPVFDRESKDWDHVPVQLTNFLARITADVSRDDGAEQVRLYEISAQLASDPVLRKGTVKAEEFDLLRWVGQILGARAVIFPSKKEHTATAIRLLSPKIATRYVIAHTGWRDGIYYHGGGAIAAEGLVEADVELPAALAPCILPGPPTDAARTEAVRVVFDLLNLAPDEITAPHFGAVLAALLGNPDFSTFLFGYTNSGKSELAALAQAFFGAGFHAKNLPASWSSTANALEGLAHTVKDCVLVIDDFCPLGNAAEQARFHAAADRVLRAQGNHSGRIRCRTDGSVRPVKPPRGLIISTGEDVPRGQSLRTRLFVIEVPKDALNWGLLTKCQTSARDGVYAGVTSAYLQWLATNNRIDKIQAKASEEIGKYRDIWLASKTASVKRTASTLAQLTRAWRTFLEFALDCGAATQSEVNQLWLRIETALKVAGEIQAKFQATENPATRFIELIQAAFSSGRAHLTTLDGGRPNDCQSWGWREDEKEAGAYKAHGDRVGWIDGGNIFLQPDAAFAVAQRMASGGEGLTVTSQTLWKRLKEAGLLASTDTARDTLKVRRRINGKDQSVIHLLAEKIS